MDASPHQERVRQLERELDSLRAYLEEKENSLVKAAELGRALLRENEALEERLTETTKESTQKLEELEQERFSLQQKLDCQRATLLTVQHDAESVKTELRREYEMREEHMKQAHSKKLYEVEQLCCDLRGENDRLETQVKTSREKMATMEERVREMTERMEVTGSSSSSSGLQPELRELEQQYKQERSEREQVQSRLCEVEEECGLLRMEVEELTGKIERLTDECQERSDQANQWYKALQSSKEQVMELNVELESLKMDAGNSHSVAGNSLFGEVDDRRLQVERKYVSLWVKHDCLEKRHTAMSQQYKRLKTEMSSMLCQFSVVGADSAHIRRLEVALRQAQTEKETLLTKLHRLEKQQVSVLASQERLQYVAAFGDKKEYIALLELQLNKARKENSTVTKDLEMKGLQLVWETQKLRETEARLHHKEQEMARGKKELSVLKLKLHEQQEKMEKAESCCEQQESQVNLLEKELQLQRQSRGPQQRRGSTSRNISTTTNSSTVSSLSTTQHSVSLENELSSSSGGQRRQEEEEEEECGSEKENMRRQVTHSQKREKVSKRDAAPLSFLEDVECELEKQANTCRSTEAGQTKLTRNIPKVMQSVNVQPPVYPVTTRKMPKNSNVNQCPQQ